MSKRYLIKWGFESEVFPGRTFESEVEMNEEEAKQFSRSLLSKGVKVSVEEVKP